MKRGVDSVRPPSQKRVLRLRLAAQRRSGSPEAGDTEARLQELCSSEGWSPDASDGEDDEEEEMENSEPLDDSDVVLSDSGELSPPNLRPSSSVTANEPHVRRRVASRRRPGGL